MRSSDSNSRKFAPAKAFMKNLDTGNPMKKKKFLFDVILNIMAAGIPIVVLQLIIYPLVSRKLDSEVYGLLISTYAFIILVSDSLGKSINNIRLIRSNEEANTKGDYNLVLMLFTIVNSFAITGGILFYNSQTPIPWSCMSTLFLTSILYIASAYMSVYFRIRLNYISILNNSFCQSIGFLIGYMLYNYTGNWASIFLCGQGASFIFLCCATTVLREPFRQTERFRSILSDCTLLTISLFLSQGVVQADKLLLFPLLGGATVSVYYTATLMGKVLSLATSPINSVILTYLARKDLLSRNTFKRYIALCTLACTLVSLVILVVSKPVLGFLFPQFVDEAMVLVPYTTLNILLFSVAGMITPLVLKFCDIYWQIVINAIGVIAYVVLSVFFLKLFGIKGFCIGIACTHCIRLFLLIQIYLKNSPAVVNKE